MDYNNILNNRVKKKIEDSISGAIFEGNKGAVIDTEGIISNYADTLTPNEYSLLDWEKAEDFLIDYMEGEFKKMNKETKNPSEQEAILKELSNFTGSESYFKSFTGLLYTEGIKHLADSLKAHWLVDLIGSYRNHANNKPFLVWRIETKEEINGKTALITAREDTNTPVLIKQKIPFTDFKLNEYELYCIDGVLLLKSEY